MLLYRNNTVQIKDPTLSAFPAQYPDKLKVRKKVHLVKILKSFESESTEKHFKLKIRRTKNTVLLGFVSLVRISFKPVSMFDMFATVFCTPSIIWNFKF